MFARNAFKETGDKGNIVIAELCDAFQNYLWRSVVGGSAGTCFQAYDIQYRVE